MSKNINPDYVIYQAIKKLKAAQDTSIESPWKIKLLVKDTLEILRDYYNSKS